MPQEKAVKGFNLPHDLIKELMRLKEVKSINLSKWVEKILRKEVIKELGGIKEDVEE